MNDGFGHWLAGFIDGEGCFMIRIKKRQKFFTPIFSLRVRADENEVMESIRDQTCIGKLYFYPHNGIRGNPCIIWEVARKDDCRKLVTILDKYPLRAKKRRDFGIWREAVLTEGKGRQKTLAILYETLKAVRTYKAPSRV
jgi:hypothetical protein